MSVGGVTRPARSANAAWRTVLRIGMRELRGGIKGFVLEMVKVVLIPVAKVDVAAGESIVAPSDTEYPPVSSDPVIIVKADVCGSEIIASLPAAQLPVPEE